MSDWKLDLSDVEVYMRKLPSRTQPLKRQMAIQEVEARNRGTAERAGAFGVFRPSLDAITMSRHQDPDIIDWDAVDRWDIEVTRRNSQGGSIYHDAEGDLTFVFGVTEDVLVSQASGFKEGFKMLFEPIGEALSRMGVEWTWPEVEHEKHGRDFDVCYLRDTYTDFDIHADNQKICATIGHFEFDNVIIQQGAINYSFRPEREVGLFDIETTPEQFANWTTSVEEQGDVGRDEAANILEETLQEWTGAQKMDWTDEELHQAEYLAENKYATDQWIMEGEDPIADQERLELFE